jgi:hypothetical protein
MSPAEVADAPVELKVRAATCRAVYVFDVAREIDLAACRRLVPDLVRRAQEVDGRPTSICVETPPLRLQLPSPALALEGLRLCAAVSIGVYEFGAVAVTFAVPLEGTLDDLRAVGTRLTGNSPLAAVARACASEVSRRIGPAALDPATAHVAEEYLVFEVTDFETPGNLENLVARSAHALAAVLRSENGTLSAQEVQHATATCVNRTPDDLTIIDWNAAIVFHRHPEEIREVLEFANVQLLEMRFLDATLDESLNRSYALVSEKSPWRRFLPHALGRAMQRIAQRQVDGAILHERVSNALKLVGDQHLARIYRGAAARFELAEWNAANLQKLATLDSVYTKVHDRAAAMRAELLEWLVILLIASSMVFPFFK